MLRGTAHRTTLARTLRLMAWCVLAACSVGDTASGPSVSVSIEPDVVEVVAGTSQPFVATVNGKTSSTVSWSLEEGSRAGSISSTGVYRASNQPGEYHVTAGRAGSSGRGRATVSVVPRQDISVTIASPVAPAVALAPGATVAFLAAVSGSSNHNVVWTIETGLQVPGGSINVNGVYTAPPLAAVLPYLNQQGSLSLLIRARSAADPSKSGTRPVAIQQQSVPLTLSPPSVVVGLGGSVPLALSETLLTPTTWTVNNVVGGNAAIGTTSPFGGYRAPFQLPVPGTVIVGNSAASNAVVVRVVSRFLAPEAIPVQACSPSCPAAQPIALAAADFNRDGLLDLATANQGSGTVSVLTAADSLHFATAYRLPFGADGTSEFRGLLAVALDGGDPVSLATIDVDGSGAAIRARRGVGDGTFSDEVVSDLPLGTDPVAAAFGGFDSDSIRDLVVADAATAMLHVLRGAGDGRFSLLASFGTAAGSAQLTALAVSDFDRNGRDDLAVGVGNNTVTVWLTNLDGSVRNAQTIVFQPGSVPKALIPADLNQDAAPDLIVTFGAPSGVAVVLNAGAPQTGRFQAPSLLVDAGPAPASPATGDFNKDGFPDLAVANPSAETVTTLFGDGVGGLVRSETYSLGMVPNSVAVGDFNGDGWDDVAVAHREDDSLSILRNRGGPAAP